MRMSAINILNGFGMKKFLQTEKEKTDKSLAAEE